jgi:propanol-preferring alcohol dehydrogenase
VKKFPDPKPQANQVIVRMKAAGICGSDLRRYRYSSDVLAKRGGDYIPGHEPSGIVEIVGKDVANPKQGDRVIVYHAPGCGYCYYCLNGNMLYCENRALSWNIGEKSHGACADLVLAPAISCLRIPDELSFIDGAIMGCAGGTAYEMLRNLRVSAIDTVAVYGLGPLGLCAVQVSKGFGAKVIGVEPIKERRDLAISLGACYAVNPVEQNTLETLRSLTNGEGVDVAVDFSGSPSAQENALDCVKPIGRVGLVGHGVDRLTIRPSSQIIKRSLTVRGGAIFNINTYFEMAKFMLNTGVRFEHTVTHRFTIDQAPEAFRLFDTGKTGKIVIVW